MRILLFLFLMTTGVQMNALTANAIAQAEAVARINVERLTDEDPEVRCRAKLMLLRPECLAQAPKYARQIEGALSSVECEEDAILLGCLKLTPERKQELLNSSHTPDPVRARLGDSKARLRVTERFRDATTAPELRKSGTDLLYIGDREALAVFSGRMASDKVFRDVHGNQFAEAQILIQLYGQTHPEASLFQPDAYLKHADVSTERFRDSVHQEYLRQLERHFLEKHGLEVSLNPPLLLDTRHQGIYRAKTTTPQP